MPAAPAIAAALIQPVTPPMRPTAVAVMSDLHAILRQNKRPLSGQLSPGAALQIPHTVSGEFTVPHYLRFVVRDRPGIVAEVASILSKYRIGIDALLQRPGYPRSALPFTMTLESLQQRTPRARPCRGGSPGFSRSAASLPAHSAGIARRAGLRTIGTLRSLPLSDDPATRDVLVCCCLNYYDSAI